MNNQVLGATSWVLTTQAHETQPVRSSEMSMMKVTSKLFKAFLQCPTKCWLYSRSQAFEVNAYAEWAFKRSETYRADGIKTLFRKLSACERDGRFLGAGLL